MRSSGSGIFLELMHPSPSCWDVGNNHFSVSNWDLPSAAATVSPKIILYPEGDQRSRVAKTGGQISVLCPKWKQLQRTSSVQELPHRLKLRCICLWINLSLCTFQSSSLLYKCLFPINLNLQFQSLLTGNSPCITQQL